MRNYGKLSINVSNLSNSTQSPWSWNRISIGYRLVTRNCVKLWTHVSSFGVGEITIIDIHRRAFDDAKGYD